MTDDLVWRLLNKWRAWGAPTIRDECINETCMAMDCKEAADEISRLQADVERLTSWVADLQSGMYVNCVYCGHRYGPGETTPVSMADALKAHIETCPQHPMSALRAENLALHEQVAAIESREVCTVAGG